MAAASLAPHVGVAPACRALGVPRATLYRRQRRAPGRQQPRNTPARALDAAEREHVLDVLACPRFVDRAPAEVVATLLDEGQYLCSERTMVRLLADLGVTRSLSRPRVSDDNPFSEAQFKTLKDHPGFPARFADIAHASAFCRSFFAWYNTEHRYGGIAMLTPDDVHHGRAQRILDQRERT